MHRICGCRVVCREVLEAQSNYKQSYLRWFRNVAFGDSTGSNQIEKEHVCVPPGLVWGKGEEWCDLMCVEHLYMIWLMFVLFMSFSRVVSMVLVLWRVSAILVCADLRTKLCCVLLQESEMSTVFYSRNLILGTYCFRITTLNISVAQLLANQITTPVEWDCSPGGKNIYLLPNFDNVNLLFKTNERDRRSKFATFVIWSALIVVRWVVVAQSRNLV